MIENQKFEEKPVLTVFHFNDVYNIQPDSQEPKAGAAYFNSLLQREKKKYQQTLTLFSGDAFSPSLLSTEFQGQNMIKPLNSFGIDLACFGNHDLDYQLDHVMSLVSRTNFPWLLSNIYDNRTQRRLAQGQQFKIIEKNGLRIGFFSLAEQEWIDTVYPYYKAILQYIPFIDFATSMVKKLRQVQKCDLVIALTHMMFSNDVKLAKCVKGIDLIMGGHDHYIKHQMVNGTVIIKSGCDFRYFTIVNLRKMNSKYEQNSDPNKIILKSQKWIFETILKQVNHEKQNIQPDPELNHYIEDIYKQFKQKQEKIALYTTKDLDLRFSTIRKQQSPFLQFLVSIYRHESEADIAMMNSGNFRMDCYINAGPVTFGMIQNIITDTIVVKLVPGEILIQSLENCVSMYPNSAGRYSAFSGISFVWDCSLPPKKRVIKQSIKVHEEPLDLNRIYKVAVHSFAATGGDGFQCLKGCKGLQRDGDKINRQLVHDLLHINHYLLDSYKPKYPNHYNIITVENHEYLNLTLPDPKNVKMICSTGQIFDQH